MALTAEIEAESPDVETPGKQTVPSMESAPAPGGTPGLLGWLSRPDVALKLSLATLILGAASLFLTPFATPRHVWRAPPPLPPRAPARRPPQRPPAPLPAWMRAPTSAAPPAARVPPRAVPASTAGVTHSLGDRGLGRPSPPAAPAVTAAAKPAARPAPSSSAPGPLRIVEPGGVVCKLSPAGVTVGARRAPAEWAREARRLFAPPSPAPAAPDRPLLRLLAPDPGDTTVDSPPTRLLWAPVPGVERYVLTLEALTNPEEQVWQPVRDLFSVEVPGTEYALPADLEWTPGRLYRWRVEAGDDQGRAQGRFRVLSTRQREQMEAARRLFGTSHLLRAAIYRFYGFHDAALTEVQALQGAQPNDPALRRAELNLQADQRRGRLGGRD